MIFLSKNDAVISISLHADLINTSSQAFDMNVLKIAVISQLARVYRSSVGKYELSIDVNIHVLQKPAQCSPKNILFQIVDVIAGNNPAEADFKGMRIKLNQNAIHDIITHKNIKTIPHELGHLFGWDHPHAKAKYESINLEAHTLEQQLTEEERKYNLMSQTWYAQKAMIPLEKAIRISEKQIDLLLLNYSLKQLNKNFHLNHFLFWSKLLP